MHDDLKKTALASALEGLASADAHIRSASLERLEETVRFGLDPAETSAVIRALPTIPAEAEVDDTAVSSCVIRMVTPYLNDDHLDSFRAVAPRLSEDGYESVIVALSSKKTRLAAKAYINVLREHGWPKRSYPLLTRSLEQEPRYPDVVLPAFVDGSIAGLPDDVTWLVLLAYGKGGLPVGDLIESGLSGLIDILSALVDEVEPLQQSAGIAWRWTDEYFEPRYRAGLAFDAFGHVPGSPRVTELLRRGEHMTDSRLRMYAIASLVRHGAEPEAGAIDAVAGDPETRNRFYRMLWEIGRHDLFPKRELKQEKIAESDMVNWLTYPTELSRAPDEIELMHSFERTSEGGVGSVTYHLFRFRCLPPHWSADDGWMAGVSGPYRLSDVPGFGSTEDTFSQFKPWNEMSPEEHLTSTTDLMHDWREKSREP